MGIFREVRSRFKALRRESGSVLRGSFAQVSAFFGSGRERDEVRRGIYSLVKLLFVRESELSPRQAEVFKDLLEEIAPDANSEKVLRELEETPEPEYGTVLGFLRALPPEKRDKCITFQLALAARLKAEAETMELLKKISLDSGMGEQTFAAAAEEIRKIQERKEKVFRSGTGIIAALIVLAVFILTATLLRSVIFGLILAYLLLPLERLYENSWRRKRGPGYWLGILGGYLTWLPRTLASALSRRGDPPSPEQLRKKEEQRIISRAVSQTVFTALIAACLFVGAVSTVTTSYLRGVSLRIKAAAEELNAAKGREGDSPATAFLRQTRERLLAIPAMKYLIDKMERTLKDEKARDELLTMLVRRSGGVFSFFFSVMGAFGTLVFDLLLTVFFGLLFLMKLAEFRSSGQGSQADYAAHTILGSNWLPSVSESTLSEAKHILNGVFSRLRVWVRGYLSLVLIDSTVYTILFGLLDVPCFPLLGILAGCGILLPYVGPIFSCGVTLLVTWIAGDASFAQLVLVACCYLLYNGVVEQFILYPLVIGESLGLTTLETIIVVLLGAIFAGIPGMILALPAASVIKYLVPRIYRCWDGYRSSGPEPRGA